MSNDHILDRSRSLLGAESKGSMMSTRQQRRQTARKKPGSDARKDVLDYNKFSYKPERKHVINLTLSPIDFERQQK